MRFELHCHTEKSKCSELKINHLVKYLKTHNYDGAFITDHDYITLSKPIEIDGIYLYPGVEITSKEGYHILGLNISEMPKQRDLISIIEFIYESGGTPIIAHPFGYLSHGIARTNLDTYVKVFKKYKVRIEIINCRNLDIEDMLAKKFVEKYRLNASYGGDVHFPYEIGQCMVECNPEKLQRIKLLKCEKKRYLLKHIHSNISKLRKLFKRH